MTIKPILHLAMNGDAKDSSGNNNHGTVTGATLCADRFGRANSAYEFTVSDKITVSHNDTINLTSELSIGLWVYPTVHSGYPEICWKWGTGEDTIRVGYGMRIDTDKISAYFGKLVTGSDGIVSDEIIPLNKWTFCTLTRKEKNAKLYMDGTTVKEVDFNESSWRDAPLVDLGINYTDGKLDDIRIYDVALTPTQVKFLYDTTKRRYGR